MTNQKTNPKVEWGFYAITPRIVRTHYKDCSHAEKWLYTCLKDLCGDKGTCFRSLRSLSEETGISIASLSTMIPHLHAVGLIHAEKKSRGRGGKEVWHISIVDIWQANKEYCSKNEQVSDGDVQELNNNVQNLNNSQRLRSNFERSCSNFSDRRITQKNNITEERTIEEESTSNIPDTHTFVSSDTARADSLQDEQVFTDEKPQGDDHATAAAAGHSHRVDDAAACGDDTSHSAVDSGQVAAPEDRPVLEAQEEIDEKGQTDDTQRNYPADSSRSDIDTRSLSNSSARVLGNQAREQRAREGTAHQNVATGNNPGDTQTQKLAETPTTPMPAQSLSLPQAEQAASGTELATHCYLCGKLVSRMPVPGPLVCASCKRKAKKQAESKPETPKGPPVEPPADMAWGTRKCLMWFDFWRGGILIGKWKLMQASTCAKGLAEQFDEQTVIQARTDMEADPYYAAKGGCDVCDVANNIHKYLKRRQGKQQPAIQPALKVVKRYSSYDDPNFRSDQDFYPVEGGSYATASR